MAYSPIKYRWQWQLHCCPTEVWNLIADANRLKVALGIGVKARQMVGASADGKAEKPRVSSHMLNSLIGPVKDIPVNWKKENEFCFEIISQDSAIAKLEMQVRLESGEGSTTVTHVLAVTPGSMAGKFAIPWAVGKEVYQQLDKLYADFSEYLEGQGDNPFMGSSTCMLMPDALCKVRQTSERLVEEGYRDSWVKLLVQYLSQESDATLEVMQPFAIADLWGAPKKRIMELFLSATSLHLLRLRWQIRCPNCQGVCGSKMSLKSLRRRGYCSKCDLHFPNHLADTVELTFTPHPTVRTLKKTDSLYTGPVSVPHIHVQQMLQAEEVKTFPADFLRGHYRIRVAGSGDPRILNIDLEDGVTQEISVEIEDTEAHVRSSSEGTGIHVRLCNRTKEPLTVCFEDDSWKNEVLMGTQVINSQLFRNRFPAEVLPINDPLPTGKIALIIADIAASTSLFINKGDNRSYFLVREFYDFLQNIIRQYDGTLIKCMGDMIVAAFVDPVNAANASLVMRKEFETFNATLAEDERLTIRLAAHYGPCFAVNFNNLLDYFGKTVNIAWSIKQESQGNDVVYSKTLWRIPQVRQLLELPTHNLEPFKAWIRGIDKEVQLYRIY